MEIILHAEGKNYKKLQDRLLKDEVVNRASIIFKEASQFGKESGYFVIVRGDEERLQRALEIASDEELAEEVKGGEKEDISKKIKEEEDKAIEGFGGIFG